MLAKRHAVNEARTVVDIALEVAGGAAFFRGSPLERAYRDVRGGPFHPLTPEATLELVGRAGAGPDYQPRSRHSARCGRSAPSVESLPWPG